MSKTDRSKWSVLDLFFRPSAVLVRVPLEADPAQERLNALGPNVPCPTVRSEQMLKFRLLVEEDMLPVTQAGGCCMAKVIKHRYRFHTQFPTFPNQFPGFRLGKGMGPRKHLQTIVAEHSPEFDNDMGVLAQSREPDQLLNEIQIILRKNADVNHAFFQQIIALLADPADDMAILLGLQLHKHHKEAPRKSAHILSNNSASVAVCTEGILLSFFKNGHIRIPDHKTKLTAWIKFKGGCPQSKAFPKRSDGLGVHLKMRTGLYKTADHKDLIHMDQIRNDRLNMIL